MALAFRSKCTDQVRNKIHGPFVPLGVPTLKNISLQIPVYKIALPSSHPVVPTTPKDRPRIAVLPLTNISGHADDEYFADGITEELIQMLSKIDGLRVIARSSMMRFKGANVTPASVARELGVTAVVEGGIRKSGSRIRVTARLIDVSNDETLWSRDYDREARDVFDLQSEVSTKIADALKVEILGSEQHALQRALTTDPDAHGSYLKGRHLLNRRTDDSLRQALRNFQVALKRDPHLANVYAGIADAYSTLAWLEFVRPRYAFPRSVLRQRRRSRWTQPWPTLMRCWGSCDSSMTGHGSRLRASFDVPLPSIPTIPPPISSIRTFSRPWGAWMKP